MKKRFYILYFALLLLLSAHAQIDNSNKKINLTYNQILSTIDDIDSRISKLKDAKGDHEHDSCLACIPADANGVIFYKSDGTKINIPLDQIDEITVNKNKPEIREDEFVEGKNVSFTVDGVSFTMIAVKAGTFKMGSTIGESNEVPVHEVTLTNDYYIGETEVTQALWKAVTGYSPINSTVYQWTTKYGKGNLYPAYYVSYDDVISFIEKLNAKTGKTFRMPTEAEWEYAARGGNKSKGYTYSGSNTIDDVAWYTSNSSSKTHYVKTKSPNELGIYDMSGNVWEWCSDYYDKNYYSSSLYYDPYGPSTGSEKVYRGGSFGMSATGCRSTYRGNSAPTNRYYSVGFRLALSPSK